MERRVKVIWALGILCLGCRLTALGAPEGIPVSVHQPSLPKDIGNSPDAVQVKVITLAPQALPGSTLNAVTHAGPRHWTIQFQQRASLGGGLAGGDVNGDGYPDLFIGAPRARIHLGFNTGLVVLFRGGPNGLGKGFDWVEAGDERGGNYGNAVALCDINGDAFADLFVGVPRALDSSKRNGRILAYYGTADQISTEPQDYVPRADELAYGPTEVIRAGDVNGDGIQDLLGTSRYHSGSLTGQGAAFLYLGSKTGLVTRSAWQAYGSQSNETFGAAATGVGDVNGDGYHDVLIGAPGYATNGTSCGRAYLYFGSAKGLQRAPGWIHQSSEPEANFGRAVESASDVNNDGLSDFLVSAPGNSSNTNIAGSVFLFLGARDGRISEPAWQMTGEKPAGMFGFAMSSGGDVDGDGLRDLLVSAPFVSENERKGVGRVYLFRGNGSNFYLKPEWILHGANNDANTGQTLCHMVDLNRDGFAELIIGSPHFLSPPAQGGKNLVSSAGRVDVFYGGAQGFRSGQLFPTDGVNSQLYQPVSRMEPAPVMAAVDVPKISGNHFRYTVHILLALTLGVSAFWLRHTRRSAARAERARIARDLHDDLGAQLSRLQHEAVGVNPESTREAMLALDRAVWSVNPENDTLENLVSFIGQYGAEFFAESGIRFRFDAPMDVPDEQLSPEWRKHVFLAVKEALHNVLKHSGASEVLVTVHLEMGLLKMVVEDNGKGGLSLPKNGGNGLKNMAERMKVVRGEVNFGHGKSGGACVTFLIPSAT